MINGKMINTRYLIEIKVMHGGRKENKVIVSFLNGRRVIISIINSQHFFGGAAAANKPPSH
jgi:hypothetical protein